MEVTENSLVRYGFLKILKEEFNIHIKEEELDKIELASRCIFIYDSPEDFYESTGWARDNPDASDFSYLLEQKICSVIQGKVWYFSQLYYEDGVKSLLLNRAGNATTLRRQ